MAIAVTQNTPHFWESYYDPESAEFEYFAGSLLHLLHIGDPPRKPPHMGGDPSEYFGGTRFDGQFAAIPPESPR